MNPLRTLTLALAAATLLSAAPSLLAEPVNINTADAATLARELVGVGEARARAIVTHRKENGPFRSIEELTLVKGIGPRVIEQNRAVLRVDAARPAVRTPASAQRPTTGATPPVAPARSGR